MSLKTNLQLNPNIQLNDWQTKKVFTNATLTANAVNATVLDLGIVTQYTAVMYFGKATPVSAGDVFDILVSSDGVNYFIERSVKPVLNAVSGKYEFLYRTHNINRYVKFQNPHASNNITAMDLYATKLK